MSAAESSSSDPSLKFPCEQLRGSGVAMVVEAGQPADIGQKESTVFLGDGGKLGWYHDDSSHTLCLQCVGLFVFPPVTQSTFYYDRKKG